MAATKRLGPEITCGLASSIADTVGSRPETNGVEPTWGKLMAFWQFFLATY